MAERSWRCRAINMRLWATKVTDPYTKIEMMALADLYDRKAESRRKSLPVMSNGRRSLGGAGAYLAVSV
jgi:hypothetical protein